MFSINTIVLLAILTMGEASKLRPTSRFLSEELIAGYEPLMTVTDHNAIDLDQKAMETELGTKTDASFANARRIYEEGGYSKSYAVFTIPAGLNQKVTKGAEITGVASDGTTAVAGTALEDTESGATQISVQYKVSDKQASYVDCQVGGLTKPNLVGCFNATGIAFISGSQYQYSYDPSMDNNNARTLQYFSTSANERMRVNGNGNYYADFQKFFEYYGQVDYADAFISAAFGKQSANLGGKVFDFSSYTFAGQSEAIKKGSAFMSTSMYVIRELEDALDDCSRQCGTQCNDDAVYALDEAVAFYTGSLEGWDGSGDGVLHYSLADKRCINFKTCGPEGTAIEGTSKVNLEIFKDFKSMQKELVNAQCEPARVHKENAVKKIWIPLIQGTLRYAYILSTTPQTDDKAQAEGVTFAAAVLPMIASCDPNDAATIFNNMHPAPLGSTTVDFQAVKKAFENNYGCLGITCPDVGGLYDDVNGAYFDGAGPCGSSSSSSSSGANVGLAVGLSIGAVVAIALLALFIKRRRNATSEIEFKSEPGDNHI